jgi:hypothetical protein
MGELLDKKIITCQGKQGYWVKKSSISPFLTTIKNSRDLDNFLFK